MSHSLLGFSPVYVFELKRTCRRRVLSTKYPGIHDKGQGQKSVSQSSEKLKLKAKSWNSGGEWILDSRFKIQGFYLLLHLRERPG